MRCAGGGGERHPDARRGVAVERRDRESPRSGLPVVDREAVRRGDEQGERRGGDRLDVGEVAEENPLLGAPAGGLEGGRADRRTGGQESEQECTPPSGGPPVRQSARSHSVSGASSTASTGGS